MSANLANVTEGIDWEGTLWECISHLQALIRMDTVNPPGREISVARYLDDVLRGAGIPTTLLEPAPGRAALIGRLSGSAKKKPVLLLAHMDVAGVERERWKTNPFGGEVLDGFVYGRGAIDATITPTRRHLGPRTRSRHSRLHHPTKREPHAIHLDRIRSLHHC